MFQKQHEQYTAFRWLLNVQAGDTPPATPTVIILIPEIALPKNPPFLRPPTLSLATGPDEVEFQC